MGGLFHVLQSVLLCRYNATTAFSHYRITCRFKLICGDGVPSCELFTDLFLIFINNSTFKTGINVIHVIAIYELAIKLQFNFFLPAAIVLKTLGYKRLILCLSSLL